MSSVFRAFVEKLGGSDASTFVGNRGELFYDPETSTLRVSDGSTPGGIVVSGGGGATAIDDISDVDTSTVAPTDGQALVWDNANSQWEPGTISSDVTSVNTQTGAVSLGVDDLSDVDTSTVAPTDGQALVWDNANSQWEPGSSGTTLPAAQDGEALIYENGQWVAGPVIGGVDYNPGTGDTYYNNVELLLLANSTNGSTTFTDSSSNTRTATINGNTQISTVQSKFGGSSIVFDGNSDYLSYAYDAALCDWAGSSAFTIEAWVYASTSWTGWARSGTPNVPSLCGVMDPTSSSAIWSFGPDQNGYLTFIYFSDTRRGFSGTTAMTTGEWHHIAMTYDGTLMRLFVDGVLDGSSTVNGGTPNDGSGFSYGLTIGQYRDTCINGYVDDLRITQGTARYTATFTAPTAELPSISANNIVVPYSIDKLDDVDTSTVAPTDGQALVWDNANSQWEPGTISSDVTSVNTLTGAVSLGVEDLDDFELQTGPPTYGTWNQGNTLPPPAGEWYSGSGGSWTYIAKINKVDADGTDWSTELTALGTTGTFWYSTDAITWTQKVNTNGIDQLSLNDTFNLDLEPLVVGGSVPTYTGPLYIAFVDPSSSAVPIALADGDILQYNSTDSKFKPAQAAGVRSLLGIGEYADDTAAGTGGLSSGELYYNTTSSSYVLKT